MAAPRYPQRYTFACSAEMHDWIMQFEEPADAVREAIELKMRDDELARQYPEGRECCGD